MQVQFQQRFKLDFQSNAHIAQTKNRKSENFFKSFNDNKLILFIPSKIKDFSTQKRKSALIIEGVCAKEGGCLNGDWLVKW